MFDATAVMRQHCYVNLCVICIGLAEDVIMFHTVSEGCSGFPGVPHKLRLDTSRERICGSHKTLQCVKVGVDLQKKCPHPHFIQSQEIKVVTP